MDYIVQAIQYYFFEEFSGVIAIRFSFKTTPFQFFVLLLVFQGVLYIRTYGYGFTYKCKVRLTGGITQIHVLFL